MLSVLAFSLPSRAATSVSFPLDKATTGTEQFSTRCRSSAPPSGFMTRLCAGREHWSPPQAQPRGNDVESGVALPQFVLGKSESRYHPAILTVRPNSRNSTKLCHGTCQDRSPSFTSQRVHWESSQRTLGCHVSEINRPPCSPMKPLENRNPIWASITDP
ncbi:hypothetical protein DFH06DRAFT_346885 [Mycena polygramma]|nr:hypothetical protein DFH06DRAFT_346885 [Mycena polygramma]